MKFEHRANEFLLCKDDGTPTGIVIVDARDEGEFFFVCDNDKPPRAAETFEEAKSVALHIAASRK